MDRFGWTDHPVPLARAWDARVGAEDLVLVVGDISWALKAPEAIPDLEWLQARTGRKLLLKGNHDFWWGDSQKKQRAVLAPYPSIVEFLHNGSAVRLDGVAIAGTRGWTCPEAPGVPGGEMGDESPRPEMVEREADRLGRSLAAAARMRSTGDLLVVAMHFPPLYANALDTAFSRLIEAARPDVCVYGHLHGPGIPAGFTGEHGGVKYVLASCDAAGFSPVRLL
jgi:predicted phosphohydrolase